jgi:membrane-associated phospholipid phosphatase
MKKETKNVGALSIKLVLISLLFIAALFIFGYVADEVVLEKEDIFDSRVFHFLAQFATPAFIKVAHAITFFGSTYFFFPAYTLLVLYFLFRRKPAYALDIALVGVSSTLMMTFLKKIFHRQRPDHPIFKALTNYSFPSGHALSSFIFCSVLIYIVWHGRLSKAWKWTLSILLFLFAISIGISRIILRYHYASDVLAGMCLGFAWAMFSLWLLRKFRHHKIQPRLQKAARMK